MLKLTGKNFYNITMVYDHSNVCEIHFELRKSADFNLLSILVGMHRYSFFEISVCTCYKIFYFVLDICKLFLAEILVFSVCFMSIVDFNFLLTMILCATAALEEKTRIFEAQRQIYDDVKIS